MFFSYQLNSDLEAKLMSVGVSANQVFRNRNSDLYVQGYSAGDRGSLSSVFVSYALSQNPKFDGVKIPGGGTTVFIEWNDGSREISQLMLWSATNGFTTEPKERGKAVRWLLNWGMSNHPDPIIKAGVQRVMFAAM